MADVWDQFPDAGSAQPAAAPTPAPPAQDAWSQFPDVQPPQSPHINIGMGGYNPLAGRLMGAAQVVNDAVGIRPTAEPVGVREALGPAEAVLSLGSSAVATPIAGGAGLIQSVKNLIQQDPTNMSAADRVAQWQSRLTYQPRTNIGAGMANVVAMPGQGWANLTNRAGEVVADATGSPALGAAVKTAGDIAPGVIGARGAGVRRPVREPSPRRTEGYTPRGPEPVPTTAELSAAAKRAYSDAKESGVVVPADSYSKALARIQGVIKEEGINNTLHPKTAALLKQLEETAGKDLSITEAENLRRVIQEVAGDLDPVTRKPTGDAFRASKILDEFDDAIDQLSVNTEARQLWARSRKSQMLDDMIHRAEIRAGANYTQAGMETALRQEFRQLAMNPRRMRGFTKEQRAAIEKVAKGGPLENTLRTLGKFDPTTGGVAALASVGTGSLLAPFTGGAGLALPLIGFGAKRAATRATARNVDAAREALVGRGMPQTPSASPRAIGPTTQGSAAAGAAPASATARPQARSQRAPEAIQADFDRLLTEAQGIQQNDPLGHVRMASIRLRMAMLEREMRDLQGGQPAGAAAQPLQGAQ